MRSTLRGCLAARVLPACLLLGTLASGCTPTAEPPSPIDSAKLSPEQQSALLNDMASDWFYGQGLGETALAVGTVVVFPPYALYLLGNGIVSLAGYTPFSVREALPAPAGAAWGSVYDGVTAGPGRFTAAVAEKEFVTKELASEHLKKYSVAQAGDEQEAKGKIAQSSSLVVPKR